MNRLTFTTFRRVAAVLLSATTFAAAQGTVFNFATGSYYQLSTSATLAGARSQAAAVGGHLVTFEDAAEQSFVYANFSAQAFTTGFWIGLSDEAVEGTFVWDDGTPLSFTSWAPGEPNNQNNEDGVLLFGGSMQPALWNDIPAGIAKPAVIEIEPQLGDYAARPLIAPVDGVAHYDSTGFVLSGVGTPCAQFGGVRDRDVWFLYTATAPGTLTVSNCGGSVAAPGGGTTLVTDTTLAVWATGSLPPTSALDCADGAPQCGVNQSEVSVALQAGQTVYVQVAPWAANATIIGDLRFAFDVLNDECQYPKTLSSGPNGPFTSTFATDATPQLVGCEFTAGDVWFRYTTTTTAPLSITTATPVGQMPGTLSDPNLIIYDGCGGNILTCADGNPGVPITAEIDAIAGQTYYVRVSGWFGSVGSFHLTVEERHDVLRMRAPAGAGSLSIENLGAPPGSGYLTILTLNQGAFPSGWFFGVDPTVTEVLLQLSTFAPPFVGSLDAVGRSMFGPVTGLPPLTLYGVSLFFGPTGTLSGASVPVSFTIP